MKTKLLAPGLAAVLALASFTTLHAAEPVPLTVAVFDLESKDEAVRDLGPKVAALLNASLSAEPQLITVERSELEKILGEQELGLSGTVSADTAARVGHITGAKVLVTGRVFKADRDLVIVAKVIGTETSRVYGEVVTGDAGGLPGLAQNLAGKIARIIADKGDTLVAKTVSREERIAKLVAAVKDGKRPLVSVKISEQHIGTPVRDPAAETEVLYLLQQAGFNIVDGRSREKADIEITGEAFSAAGLRKGNLISCKARIEVKVHERKSGKLLFVDRQTSVAIDLAEPAAAKASLQNAAFELTERLLPKIAK